jgi:phosphoglycerate dehydrogenase-like enzyme
MSNFESQLASEIEPLAGQKEEFAKNGHAPRLDVTSLYLLAELAFHQIYGPEERAALSSRVDVAEVLITPEKYASSQEIWPEVEIIFSGWGMVPMDDAFFQRFPKLKVVFYGAGTVRGIVTDAFWRRKVRLTNAAAANAIPVGEFTVAQIILALKHGWQKAQFVRKHRKFPPYDHPPGAYQSTIGLISLGMIGRLVAERLRQFDLNVIAYDPYFPFEEAAKLGVKLVSMEDLFIRSNVVSCHAPFLQATEKMIQRRHFESMRDGAVFINTAWMRRK